MKVNFPNISIENVNKKVYAIDLSGGGQEPFTLKLNYVAIKTEDFELNTNQSIGVSIGNFFNFRGYPVSFSKKQSVSSGTTCELTLVDTSIILDKLWVGLQGKHGGIGPPPVRRLPNTAPRAVPPKINLNTLYSRQTVDEKISDITIYNGIGKFDDLILVGSYIDPCGDAPDDTVEDGCNPCSATEIANIDCAKSRLFEILDVDYSFSELVSAMGTKNIFFKNILRSPTGYRAQYTGSLREVLNSWCQDFGWAFYWEDEGIYLVNLSQGIDISNLKLENTINCKIEEYSESRSIEGVKKNINIAYFGKAGEVKNYTCDPGGSSGSGGSGGSGGTATSNEETHLANVVSMEMLWNGGNNIPLKFLYDTQAILETLMAASRLSPELRRILVYYKKYGFKAPGSAGGGVVTTGVKKLLGWDIKAIVSSNPSSDQLSDGYNIATIRSLYTLLSEDTSLFDKKFLDTEFKQFNYYFLIIKPFSDGGTQFEKLLCDKFTGNFYTGKPGQIKTRKFTSDFGEVISTAPDLNISHFLIGGSQQIKAIHENAGKDTVTVKVPVVWPSDSEDSDVENFLINWNKKIRNLGTTSFGNGTIQLQEGHEIWMIRGNGPVEKDFEGINLTVPKPVNQVGYVSTTITLTGGQSGSSGSGGNQSQGPTILLMPKIEIVKEYVTNVTSGFTSIQVNYQNITNNSLSNIEKGNRSCFINETKIVTYADGLMNGLNTNFSTEKLTKNYSILGLPDTLYKFSDGLTSFSIRLDQSGTRTSLSFSNLFPSEISDNLKKNQLNYLIKNSSNNKYINNTFK